jgi:hypothetical protein
MDWQKRLLSESEAAAAAALDVALVRLCAEHGLIAPTQGYADDDLAELRRVRRLTEVLDLDYAAVDVVLRMRRRMLALQAEVQRLERDLRRGRPVVRPAFWVDAEWTEVRED